MKSEENTDIKSDINLVLWMAIFITVGIIVSLVELKDYHLSLMVWCIAIGSWSAICGIGYSICDWLLQGKSAE